MEQGVDGPEKPVRVPVGEPADGEVSGSDTPGDEAATAASAGEAGGGSATAPPAAVLRGTDQDTEAAEEAVPAADTPPAGTDASPDRGDSAGHGEQGAASASAPPEATDAVADREDSAGHGEPGAASASAPPETTGAVAGREDSADGQPRAADAVAPPAETGAAAERGDSDQDMQSGTEDAAVADGKVAPTLVAAAVETATTPAEPGSPPGGRPGKRVLTGEVLSDKAEQSIVVSIAHRKKHRLYKKYRTLTKKLMAHDPDNSCRVGDVVRVIETRPLSRMKRWRVVEIVKRAG